MSASRRLRREIGNHAVKVMTLAREHDLPAGRLSEVEVAHDGWCRIFEGGACNCDPSVRLIRTHPSPDQHLSN